jgi:hypothetical protein
MEPLVLLQRVHEVSLRADPSAPTRVSQRAFDAARAGSAFPGLPAARNIARLLGVTWGDALSVAHEPEGVRAHRLSLKQKEAPLGWLHDDYVAFALRAVALRLETRTLSISEYRVERERMLAADRARWLHGRQLRLPGDEQVITHVGSWAAALSLAGLGPAPASKGDQPVVPPLVEIIDRFHAHYGTRPTFLALEAFAAGNGIPLPLKKGPTLNEALAEWEEGRAAQGLPPAVEPPPVAERPDYRRNVGAARPGERRLLARRSLEDCIDAMRRYLEGLRATARSTQRSYRDWARQQPGAPGPPGAATIGRHGGFELVRGLAQERMRAAGGG